MQNGTFIKLLIDDTVLIGEISNSINGSMDEIDTSSKDSGLVSHSLPGRLSESINFESLADDTSNDWGYATALAAINAGTKLSFKIQRFDALGVQVDPSQAVSGDGYLSSLTLDNPDNDKSTMSGTIEIDDSTTVETYNPS